MRRYPALVLACVLACAAAPVAEAANQQELGAPDGLGFVTPDCPENCQAIAQVTGFQTRLGDRKNPFKVKRPGYITSFTVNLSKPNADQVEFFKTTYGETPRVSLALIRPLGDLRFRLKKQTQAFNMEPYFGSAPTIALRQPFRVQKDDIIALSVPTWLPAFAHNLSADERWRSSHQRENCTKPNPPSAVHDNEDTTQRYQCLYRTARLLYTATFIGDPKPTNPAAKR
jgi:hypothetical protein